MGLRIALAGNPNCGKTTLFNALTGANQYVGNWPGVTVEKKEGKFKGDKEVIITDLPGIYSLSPYTPEEVAARDHLVEERPDAILNIIDGTNLERNLYLTTQLAELGIPLVCAVNMIDVVEKRGDKIFTDRLSCELGCRVCTISALKGTGINEAAAAAIEAARSGEIPQTRLRFNDKTKQAVARIEALIPENIGARVRRWYALKLFERDAIALEKFGIEASDIERFTKPVEDEADDDTAAIITNERYTYITDVVDRCVQKKNHGAMMASDRIDRVLTNRFLALPIFAAIMFLVYYVSVGGAGKVLSERMIAVFSGEELRGTAERIMINAGVSPRLRGLAIDGILGGVGAVLGFVPQMTVLFIFLSFLEGCGYMARVAFVLDRIFRKFGLSGRSFIPLLIGTGCSVPGIAASRTIENERDRRITVITTSFIPCSAKLPVIAMISGAFFGGSAWVAVSAYFIGAAAVVVSGVILKKTNMFSGEPAVFVMELPRYHLPTLGSIAAAVRERVWSFVKKAGTVILLSSVLLWFLQGYGFTNGRFGACGVENSLLAIFGRGIARLFAPLGWGEWKFAVAALSGLIAKENIVAVFGVLANGIDSGENTSHLTQTLGALLPAVGGYSFLVFNLLCAPCAAAMGAIAKELNSSKLTAFALCWQSVFAYIISLFIYQIGSLFCAEISVNPVGVICAVLLFAWLVFMIFKPNKVRETADEKCGHLTFASQADTKAHGRVRACRFLP